MSERVSEWVSECMCCIETTSSVRIMRQAMRGRHRRPDGTGASRAIRKTRSATVSY